MSSPDESDQTSPQAEIATLKMPRWSRYAGQAVDISSRHSIIIRSNTDEDKLIGPEDAHCLVDYFYHEGEFWQARIPLDGVRQVCGQAFNFSKARTRSSENGRELLFDKHGLPRRTIPILNHVQCRFTFKADQPIELFSLTDSERTAPSHLVDDIIYSLEAVGPPGVTFNIRDGLTGNTLSAHRFMSIQEMVFERLVVENQYVSETPSLPIDECDMRELLVGSLLSSHRAGMKDPYYLYRVCGTNNCTSNPFQILDSVVKYRLLHRIGSMLYRLPLNPRFYLRVRGLDTDPSYRKLLRTEFQEFLDDPEIQKRKREHVRKHIGIRRAARDSVDGSIE